MRAAAALSGHKGRKVSRFEAPPPPTSVSTHKRLHSLLCVPAEAPSSSWKREENQGCCTRQPNREGSSSVPPVTWEEPSLEPSPQQGPGGTGAPVSGRLDDPRETELHEFAITTSTVAIATEILHIRRKTTASRIRLEATRRRELRSQRVSTQMTRAGRSRDRSCDADVWPTACWRGSEGSPRPRLF